MSKGQRKLVAKRRLHKGSQKAPRGIQEHSAETGSCFLPWLVKHVACDCCQG